MAFLQLPYTDINSTTWPQIQPLLRPSPGLCIACRTLPCKIEIKSKVQLSYLFWNFSNIFSGLDFIKLWNWLKKAFFSKNNSTLKLYKIWTTKDIWKISKQVTQFDLGLYFYFAWRCSICNIKAMRRPQKWSTLWPSGWIYIRIRYLLSDFPLNLML